MPCFLLIDPQSKSYGYCKNLRFNQQHEKGRVQPMPEKTQTTSLQTELVKS